MPTATPIVRPATIDDAAAVADCVAAAYRPYLERMDGPPAPVLDDHASSIDRGRVWVAVDPTDDELLGLIVLWPLDDHLFIDNVAVHPETQGRGIGSSLLEHAASLARAHGLDEIRLYTNEVMTENLAFYPRHGFEETHRGTDAGYRRVYFRRRL